MEFANPWGLFGLLSLPTIVTIHMFHRRFPPMHVAGLHLWGAEVRVPTAGRKRERPPLSKSLIFELLAALIATLVLAQPRYGDLGNVTHLIAVLDGSASMSAVTVDGESVRDRAVQEVRRRMLAASRGSRVTVILTGPRPVMLAGPAVEWEQAEAVLATWKPALPGHDPVTALDMATQLAANGGEVVFLTDDLLDEDAAFVNEIETIAVGQSLGNVAMTAARWTVDSTTLEGSVFLRVANLGARAVTATVSGSAEGEPVFRSEIKLAAGEEKPLQADVAGGLGRLRVDVTSTDDALAIDSHIDLIEPHVRTVHIATALPTDFAGTEALQRVLLVLPDVDLGASIDKADLQIGRATDLPESRRDLWWLGIGPVDTSDEARQAAKDLLGPYLIEKRHPLMEGISLGGVVWGGVQETNLDATPLITAGSRMLLSRLSGTLTTALMLNVDLGRTNLTESPDWPIFLSNVVEQRRDAIPGLRRWNYRLNEDVEFRLFEGAAESDELAQQKLTLVSGERVRQLARTPVVEVPPLDETGIYSVRSGGDVFGEFAVNFFDAAESDLTKLRSGQREPPAESELPEYTIDNPFTWLIMAGIFATILLAFADWHVIAQRRVS